MKPIQWGDNPEYTITIWHDFTNWKLLFGINWRWYADVQGNKCFDFEFMVLCFGIELEIWQWKK